MDVSKEAEALDRKAETALRDLYKSLTAWQKCQVARHPDRPHCRDYIEGCSPNTPRWPATAPLPTTMR
jgi:acetyl-CoA carboxylase carboxyl transferase subunit alpha